MRWIRRSMWRFEEGCFLLSWQLATGNWQWTEQKILFYWLRSIFYCAIIFQLTKSILSKSGSGISHLEFFASSRPVAEFFSIMMQKRLSIIHHFGTFAGCSRRPSRLKAFNTETAKSAELNTSRRALRKPNQFNKK